MNDKKTHDKKNITYKSNAKSNDYIKKDDISNIKINTSSSNTQSNIEQNHINDELKQSKNNTEKKLNTIPKNLNQKIQNNKSLYDKHVKTSDEKNIKSNNDLNSDKSSNNNITDESIITNSKFTQSQIRTRILDSIQIISDKEWALDKKSLDLICNRIQHKALKELRILNIATQNQVDDFCIIISFYNTKPLGIRSIKDDSKWNLYLENQSKIKEILNKDDESTLKELAYALLSNDFNNIIQKKLKIAQDKFSGAYIEDSDIEHALKFKKLPYIRDIFNKIIEQGIIDKKRKSRIKESHLQRYITIALKTKNIVAISNSLKILNKILTALHKENAQVNSIKNVERYIKSTEMYQKKLKKRLIQKAKQ